MTRGQFPGVQQIRRAEHLVAGIARAGGDVQHALGVGDPLRLLVRRARRVRQVPEKIGRLIEQRHVGGGPAAGLSQ